MDEKDNITNTRFIDIEDADKAAAVIHNEGVAEEIANRHNENHPDKPITPDDVKHEVDEQYLQEGQTVDEFGAEILKSVNSYFDSQKDSGTNSASGDSSKPSNS